MGLKSIRRYFVMMLPIKAASHEIRGILKIGIPIAVQLVLEVSAFTLSAIMMGWIGNVALASHEIAIGLASFTFMIASGVSMAATIRVSFQLGARDFKSMERVSYSAVHLVLGYEVICALSFYLLRHQLPHIFSGDPRVIGQAAALLAIAALFQLFDGLQIVCLGVLRGFADVKAPMFISVLSYIVVGLVVSYLCAFPFKMGPVGIWYGFLAGLIVAGISLSLRIRRNIERLELP